MGARGSKARYTSGGAEQQEQHVEPTLPRQHKGAVLGVCSVGAERVVTCGEDKTMALLDLQHGSIAHVWRGHTGPVNRVTYGCKAGLLYSSSRDTTLAQWRMAEEAPVRTFAGHKLTVAALHLSEDELRLVSGSRDTSVRQWDTATGQLCSTGSVPRNLVTCLKHLPAQAPGGGGGGSVVVQGSEDLHLRVWDFRAPSTAPARTIGGFVYFPLCLDVSGDGTYVLTGSKGFNSVGCEVRLWDLRTGQTVHEYLGHAQDVTACMFGAALGGGAEGLLVTASKDQTIKVWRRDDPLQPVAEYAEAECGAYTGLACHAPSRLCATTFTGGIYDLQLGAEPQAGRLTALRSLQGQSIE